MAQITYPFNPYNSNSNNRVTESFTLTADRNLYIPRAAPFFLNDFELYSNATVNQDGTITGTRLTLGNQAALANPFDVFIKKYQINVLSALVVPAPNNGQYVVRYNTVGGPFVLDEIKYAEFVANIMNHDREAFWEDFVGVPTEWPADPHEHPVNLVYNVYDMMALLRQIITVKTSDPNTILALLNKHLEADLTAAHEADKSMVGLGNVDNFATATNNDIDGKNPNLFITMGVLKEVLKRLANGQLSL
jgi:hypothetical protein